MDTGVVSQHQPAHFVGSLDVGTLFAESYLNRSRSPVNEIGKFFLSDSLKRFVDLSSINFSLNDV